MIEQKSAYIASSEFLLPIPQNIGNFSNKTIDTALKGIRDYLSKIGTLVNGNIERANHSCDLGPFHDIYHVPRDIGYTILIQRGLGAFATAGRGDEMEPIFRYGPDGVHVSVASSEETKSKALLEEILASSGNVVIAVPVGQ